MVSFVIHMTLYHKIYTVISCLQITQMEINDRLASDGSPCNHRRGRWGGFRGELQPPNFFSKWTIFWALLKSPKVLTCLKLLGSKAAGPKCEVLLYTYAVYCRFIRWQRGKFISLLHEQGLIDGERNNEVRCTYGTGRNIWHWK